MTKYALLMLPILAGCGDDERTQNGGVLYIAPDGVETRLKLVEAKPSPF